MSPPSSPTLVPVVVNSLVAKARLPIQVTVDDQKKSVMGNYFLLQRASQVFHIQKNPSDIHFDKIDIYDCTLLSNTPKDDACMIHGAMKLDFSSMRKHYTPFQDDVRAGDAGI